MSHFDAITINPEICLGPPTVRGIRFTGAFIVKMVNHGQSVAEILAEYPILEEEDIRQAVDYARTHPCEA
jgi:uncharacterized protein (DUF433 family)